MCVSKGWSELAECDSRDSNKRATVLAGGGVEKEAVKSWLMQFSPFHTGC